MRCRLLLLGTILALAIGALNPATAQPPLDQALCLNVPHGPNAGVPTSGGVRAWQGAGQPMVKVELTEPGAVCNDGTPGAMYLRPSPALVAGGVPNPARNHWVIHFKGGGGCRTFASCRARWCADPVKELNDPGLMSTAGAHLEAQGTGIFAQVPGNPFRNWNHVMLYYCSSDNYLGGHDFGEPVSPDPVGDLGHEHQIAFKGFAIVEAAFNRLLSSVAVTLPNGSGVRMPLLENADVVLLSGDSAGANGARMHADRLAAELQNANVPMGANLPVLLALDAGAAPLFDGGVLTWPAAPPQFASYTDWAADIAADQALFRGVESAHLDLSCLTFVGVVENFCYDYRYVQQNHITTPMFQRNDLLDTVANGQFISLGLAPAQADYIDATESDLVTIAPPGLELRDDIAVFGPFCTEHVSVLITPQFTGQQAVGPGLTYATALMQWVQGCMAGACPAYSEIRAQMAGAGPGATCP